MSARLWSFVGFFATMLAITAAWHLYLYARLVRAPSLPPEWQRALRWTLLGLALSIPSAFFLLRVLPRPVATPVLAVAYGWMGLGFLLFALLVASELVRVSVHAVAALRGAPLDEERRTFLSRCLAGAAALVGVGAAGAATASALGPVAVRRVRVGLLRFPDALSGYRLVQVTDLHIGPMLGREWLEGIVDRILALDPHAVVITGDLVDGRVRELREHVAPLGRLRARDGVYFVTGNHEYYAGAEEWIAYLGELGVRVLQNERVTLGEGEASFELAGVNDYSAGRYGDGPDLDRALEGWDGARELVLLAHQPRQFSAAAARGVGLQVSGHTHGGQIWPWNFLVPLAQPYVAGLFRRGRSQVYVSRGTGFWGPPMRLAAPAEITLLELSREGNPPA